MKSVETKADVKVTKVALLCSLSPPLASRITSLFRLQPERGDFHNTVPAAVSFFCVFSLFLWW